MAGTRRKWEDSEMTTRSVTRSRNGKSPQVDPALLHDSETAAPTVEIARISAETLRVPIVGTAPLIMHAWSEKAKRMMLDKKQGRRSPRQACDPATEYESAFYRTDDGGFGFPVIAFKSATVGAARFYGNDVRMTELRQFLFFRGTYSASAGQALAPIHGEPHMREDTVRLTGTSADLRYRPEFTEWTSELTVTYVASCISRDSVLSLIDAGGLGVGIGEWRPEKRGEFGTYAIDQSRETEVVG